MQLAQHNGSIGMPGHAVCIEKALELFRDRLLALSHHLDLPELQPNESNVCSIALRDDHWIHISLSTKEMQLHWTAAMTSSAYKNTHSLFSTLLSSNLDWQLTQGGFFAFDELTQVVFYRFHEPLSNLHPERFLEVTERFIERSAFWKQHLQTTTLSTISTNTAGHHVGYHQPIS